MMQLSQKNFEDSLRAMKGKRVHSQGPNMDEKIDRLVDKLDKGRTKIKRKNGNICAQNQACEVEDFKILTMNTNYLNQLILLLTVELDF